MRIISGKYGRRRFDKKMPVGIRPTLDAARESLYNSLTNHFDFEDIKVLDLCCGTGAMGIEALSRGAGHCTFVDSSTKSLAYVKEFLSYLNISKENYSVIRSDAVKYLNKLDESLFFDLIICDPPYNIDILNDVLNISENNKALTATGIIAVEYEPKYQIHIPDAFTEIYRYSGGSTTLIALRK